jgi:hypothetical protein
VFVGANSFSVVHLWNVVEVRIVNCEIVFSVYYLIFSSLKPSHTRRTDISDLLPNCSSGCYEYYK